MIVTGILKESFSVNYERNLFGVNYYNNTNITDNGIHSAGTH